MKATDSFVEHFTPIFQEYADEKGWTFDVGARLRELADRLPDDELDLRIALCKSVLQNKLWVEALMEAQEELRKAGCQMVEVEE